jgi:hypothetical protein
MCEMTVLDIEQACEFHEWESFGSEMLDSYNIVVWYQCLNCNAEREDVIEDRLEEELGDES